jgi:predicted aspartyl protease
MSASFSFHRGRLILVPIRIRHTFSARPLMAIDTGCALTLISPRIATEAGLDPGVSKSKVQLLGVAGSLWASEIILPRVSFFGMAVPNVKALCHPLPPTFGLDGILGLNFLKHFNFNVNHDTETITVDRCAQSDH